MSWKRALALIATMLVLASPAAAQKGSWLLGVDAGANLPQGDFGDYWATGFLFAASAGYRLSPAFELGAGIGFADHDPSDDYQALLDLVDATESFKFTNYGLYGKYLFGASPKVEPYLMATAGLSSVKDEWEAPGLGSEEVSQTAFAVGGGLGLDYFFQPNFGLGIRAMYTNAFTSEDEIGHDSAAAIVLGGGIRFKVIPE